ncbi:MAG TPA: serine O-acetyltransferase EpsC [Polyangiaceae bacterium]|nr:serine O-acetyltransferase EpsC [Polyangiaceae bacterium]
MSKISDPSGDLERAIDSITASYDGPELINNLESAALPNRQAVIEAYRHIAPLIYMGFFSTRPLNRNNLRYSVSEHVYPAYENLCEQIERAISYELNRQRMQEDAAAFAHRATVALLGRLPELRQMLNEDASTAYELDPAARSVEEVIFSYPTLEAITAHRVAHVLHKQGVPMIPRIISEYAHSRTGIDIHPGATIGRKAFIDHGTGVVVGETAVIGNDVKLYQGVTLGALSTRRGPHAVALADTQGGTPRKRHPTIEDKVTIYAGATILGGDTVVGEGSVIGGNVWLVKSVPPGSKIFGRPRLETNEDET